MDKITVIRTGGTPPFGLSDLQPELWNKEEQFLPYG
jgi:hypothetical protein